MRKLTQSIIALVLSSVLIISMFPPLEFIDYVFWVLSTYFNVAPEVFIMFSAVLLLLAGFLLAYSLHMFLSVGASLSDFFASLSSSLGSLNSLNKRGVTALAAASLLIVYWHVPLILDAALLQFRLHVIMNMSLLSAGFLIFIGASRLNGRARMVTATFGHMAMGIFGVYLLVTSGYNQFYSVYPLSQQVQFGLVMVIMMFAFEGVLVPCWLYRYFTRPVESLNGG